MAWFACLFIYSSLAGSFSSSRISGILSVAVISPIAEVNNKRRGGRKRVRGELFCVASRNPEREEEEEEKEGHTNERFLSYKVNNPNASTRLLFFRLTRSRGGRCYC